MKYEKVDLKNNQVKLLEMTNIVIKTKKCFNILNRRLEITEGLNWNYFLLCCTENYGVKKYIKEKPEGIEDRLRV